jgi:hypothetical protein
VAIATFDRDPARHGGASEPRFTLLEELCRTGEAAFWRAQDRRAGRTCVVRVFDCGPEDTSRRLGELHRERTLAERLGHPAVLRTDVPLIEERRIYQLVDPEPTQLLTAQGEGGRLALLAALVAVARTLGEVHARGAFHGAFGRDSCLRTADGRVVLQGFAGDAPAPATVRDGIGADHRGFLEFAQHLLEPSGGPPPRLRRYFQRHLGAGAARVAADAMTSLADEMRESLEDTFPWPAGAGAAVPGLAGTAAAASAAPGAPPRAAPIAAPVAATRYAPAPAPVADPVAMPPLAAPSRPRVAATAPGPSAMALAPAAPPAAVVSGGPAAGPAAGATPTVVAMIAGPSARARPVAGPEPLSPARAAAASLPDGLAAQVASAATSAPVSAADRRELPASAPVAIPAATATRRDPWYPPAAPAASEPIVDEADDPPRRSLRPWIAALLVIGAALLAWQFGAKASTQRPPAQEAPRDVRAAPAAGPGPTAPAGTPTQTPTRAPAGVPALPAMLAGAAPGRLEAAPSTPDGRSRTATLGARVAASPERAAAAAPAGRASARSQPSVPARRPPASAGDEATATTGAGRATVAAPAGRPAAPAAESAQAARSRVATLVAGGNRALNALEPAIAGDAFAQALALAPEDRAALEGSQRARRLQGVAALMRDAREASARGDHARAVQGFAQALSNDPRNRGLAEALASARRNLARDANGGLLAEGHAALGAGRLEAAREAFERALAADPSAPAARRGVEQAQAAIALRDQATARRVAALDSAR